MNAADAMEVGSQPAVTHQITRSDENATVQVVCLLSPPLCFRYTYLREKLQQQLRNEAGALAPSLRRYDINSRVISCSGNRGCASRSPVMFVWLTSRWEAALAVGAQILISYAGRKSRVGP